VSDNERVLQVIEAARHVLQMGAAIHGSPRAITSYRRSEERPCQAWRPWLPAGEQGRCEDGFNLGLLSLSRLQAYFARALFRSLTSSTRLVPAMRSLVT
jgi:hypothetical protein